MDKEEIIKLHDILIGSIYPVGETNQDKVVLENLKLEFSIIEELLDRIMGTSEFRDDYQDSVSKIGKEAYSLILKLSDSLNYFISECEEEDSKC